MAEPIRPAASTIRIGISACLLGQEVRFDGGHRHDRYLTDTLGQYFQWVPVCPEVELGLGTPRETIQLVQIAGQTRLRTTKTDVDLTDRMQKFAERRVRALVAENLSGYILKRDSPSCGMERVKVNHPLPGAESHHEPAADSQGRRRAPNRNPRRAGVGLFAAALLERIPNLPIEEEGRLCDPRLRENWVERVFAYHALQELWHGRWQLKDLIDFHTRYKFVLLAHDESSYRQLGRLVAKGKTLSRVELQQQYESTFMQGLKRQATVRKNVNVLQHMLGFFSKDLDAACRQELLQHIDDYHRGLVPLVVPLTLLRHYVRLHDVGYLHNQAYLSPHPKELALRNHV